MNRLWLAAKPVERADPVARYLGARIGLTAFPHYIRTAARIKYQGDPSSWHPAMIAMVADGSGKPVSLHRTYLTGEGGKANVADPRRVMEGSIPKGSAIPLAEHDGVLGVAEGIETAFAATALFGVPCWATINTTIMAQWSPPDGVREVVIFGDNDANLAGQAAAYVYALACNAATAARRLNWAFRINEGGAR